MHRSTVPSRAALFAPLFLLLSCSQDLPVSPSKAPKFNHVAEPTGIVVDVNNLRLQLNPDGLGLGTRLGHPFLYAGGVAYGTSGNSIVWWSTANTTSGLLPVSRPGPVASHQTVSLLADAHSQMYGPNTPPRLFLIQETFAFSAAVDANYVIVKYTLYNPGPATVSGLYAGQVLDLDVGADVTQNFIQFQTQPSNELVHQWMFPEEFQAGHLPLGGDPVTAFRVWKNGPWGPPELNPDPITWTAMFGILSGGIAAPNVYGHFGPQDLRHLLGLGPVSLAPGASRAFAFALLADTDISELYADQGAAYNRYDALPSNTKGPYPVEPVRVEIVPRALNLAAQGAMQAQLTFTSAAVATRFDVPSTRCAGALPLRAQVQRERVSLTFDRGDLNPNAIIGGRLICGGFLTDGTAWIGDDTVTIGDRLPEVVSATVTRLTSGPGNDMHAAWSPDGHSIAFTGDDGGVPTVSRMNLDTGGTSLVLLSSYADWPDWSPDGKTIIFVGMQAGIGGLWAVPATGGSPVRLVNMGGGMPAWSPDGSTIAFVRNGGKEVWVMDAVGELNGGASHAVATTGFSNMYPHWGRDGLLYFVARGRPDDTTSAIFRADPTVGDPSAVRVTPIEGVPNFSPTVSPDGKTLAFGSQVPVAGREIVLQGLRTGEHVVVQLDIASLGVQDRLEWSPDGRRILFSWNGDIYVADVGKVIWRGAP